jgi:hypothetical protein
MPDESMVIAKCLRRASAVTATRIITKPSAERGGDESGVEADGDSRSEAEECDEYTSQDHGNREINSRLEYRYGLTRHKMSDGRRERAYFAANG